MRLTAWGHGRIWTRGVQSHSIGKFAQKESRPRQIAEGGIGVAAVPLCRPEGSIALPPGSCVACYPALRAAMTSAAPVK